MIIHRSNPSHRRLWSAAIVLALLASIVPIASVSAAVTVTAPASGGSSISADKNSSGGTGAYTSLVGPGVSEAAIGQFGNGTIILTAPTGFEFDPAAGGASTNAGCSLGAAFAASSTPTVTISGAPSVGTACTITFTGLGVRPTAGPLAVAGPITNTGAAGTNAPKPGNYGTLTEVAGAAVLTFTSAPITSTTGGATLSPNPTFHDEDQWGNDREADGVTLGITPGTGTAGAVLTCALNPKPTSAAGNVTFTGCSIDKAGLGYQLRASLGSAFVDTTPAFNISVGPATTLAFTSYPATSTASLLAPQPAVAVTDSGGNVVTSDNSTVITLAISSNTGTFSCTGGLSKTVSAGVATFTGCTQTATGSYTLTVSSSPVHPPVVGAMFDVTSGPASKLALCWSTALACPQTPPAPTGGTAFGNPPTIRVQDAAGNTVASDNSTVITLAIASGTPSSGGPGTLTCTGGNTKTVTAGVATFAGCAIDKAGTGYRLVATSSPVLTSATSNLFNVVAGAASKLTFVVQPPATSNAGSPFSTGVQVAITDAGGNVITSGISATISLALGNNPGGATLACTGGNSANTVSGVAIFNGCVVSAQGTGYTLTATAIATAPVTPLAPATSNPFNVQAQAAAISLSSVPSTGVITWGQDVTFLIHFAVNGAGKTVSLQVSKDSTTWSTIAGAAALVTNASGDATFVYGPSDNRYYRAVFAGAPDLSAGMSPTLRVVVRQTNQLRPTNGGKIKQISHGTTITFTSTIRPNRPELPQARANFVVYQLVGPTWIRIANVIIGVDRSNGVATFSRTFASVGRFYVRSQAVPTQFNANSGWSPVEQYRVV